MGEASEEDEPVSAGPTKMSTNEQARAGPGRGVPQATLTTTTTSTTKPPPGFAGRPTAVAAAAPVPGGGEEAMANVEELKLAQLVAMVAVARRLPPAAPFVQPPAAP
mmetsp:Transcript_35917/g.90300  ORF Transcript_35917/g.90300 Transcript_35917/m.90300 type:complete len:107 (-) Transcript_35917:79-399(-)